MNSKEQALLNQLHQQHLIELKLQGLAPKTVDAYSRAAKERKDTHYSKAIQKGLISNLVNTLHKKIIEDRPWFCY